MIQKLEDKLADLEKRMAEIEADNARLKADNVRHKHYKIGSCGGLKLYSSDTATDPDDNVYIIHSLA